MAATTKAELAAQVGRLRKSLDRAKAKNAAFGKSLAEALEQQSATSEILRVISSSPGDLGPTFQTILASATRFCEAHLGLLYRYDGNAWTAVSFHGADPAFIDFLSKGPISPGPKTALARLIVERRPIHITDILADEAYEERDPLRVAQAELGRARTLVAVPMRKENQLLGAIVIYRPEVRPFAERQIDLVRTFADQAAIAIENVRLFNETTEALERQTATAEILKVISSSPTDVQPVFDAIVRSALKLIGGYSAVVTRVAGDMLQLAALTSTGELGDEALKRWFPMPCSRGIHGKVIRTRAPACVSDTETEPDPDLSGLRELARARGFRSAVVVPMIREGVVIGTISVTRRDPGPFSAHQINLLKTFADQAVIAIENVRLFNETKEALEHQKASADILRIISSSPTDLSPVMAALAESAARLCEATDAHIWQREGDDLQLVASHGPLPIKRPRLRIGRDSVAGRAAFDCTLVHVHDLAAIFESEFPNSRAMMEGGYRSVLAVPLVREGASIGAILLRRTEVRPFMPRQLALLQTFADQAVIAIENVRLFKELQARNAQITEALEQQTATSEVLRVISRSPTDTQPVFDTIAESAARLCGASDVIIRQAEGDVLRAVAHFGSMPVVADDIAITRGTVSGCAALERRTIHIHDILEAYASGEYPEGPALQRSTAYRTMLVAPLLREDAAIGTIVMRRLEVRPFSDKQIKLLETFADQAVIAIENVRLFNETKEALERQTATAEILRVISSSPTDVKPVFDTIARNAVALCGGLFANVFRYDGKLLHYAASSQVAPEQVEVVKQGYPRPPDRGRVAGRAILSKSVACIDDALADPDYDHPVAAAAGSRRMFAAPMLREGEPLGAIAVGWAEPGPIPKVQEELLKTFADQAAIAIENVRLFNETKEALDRQTATAEILKVISSSPTDVNPVFESILDNAVRLCDSPRAAIFRFDGQLVHLVATRNWPAEALSTVVSQYPQPPTSRSINGRVILTGKVAHIEDALTDVTYERSSAIAGGWRRMLGVPLSREGVAVGAISLTWPTPGNTPERHVELLKSFADQAVIAIENVRLFNETKEALERQTATAEILKVISSSPTQVQPVFEAIAESSMRLLGGWSVHVCTFDGERLQFGAARGALPDTEQYVRQRYPAPPNPDWMTGRCILGRTAINISDCQADPSPAQREFARQRGYRAGLAVPMLRHGQPIGAIAVTRETAGAFAQAEVDMLQTFADQAVIAIENVRLFKELEARTAALSRSVGQLTALGAVGQAISSSLDLEIVLRTIVSRALQLTGLDAGEIFEYDERTEEFHLWAAENLDEEIVEALRRTPMRKGEGAIGRTAVTGEPTEIPEILDASYQSRVRELLVASGLRALLAVPLLREDRIIGAIVVNRKTPGPFAPETVELLKTFATQSALAIQNARLFREIAEKSRQLEVASRHKSDFLASMSHELRTPLNAILGFNEMILGEVYGAVPPDMKEPLADIQTSGKHLLRLINNVLDLAKIEAGRMELALADYSVQDTVESVRTSLRPLAADKGLDFAVSVPNDIPLAYGDAGRITQCLMNLAGNSLKFTKAGRVEISVEQKDGLLTYRVSDTGIGIAPDKIETVFSEFRQSDATIASEYGGTGLGLSITKKFIELHGGRIWVESELGKGSSFHFEIPLRAGAGVTS